jgi:hypothetical protein
MADLTYNEYERRRLGRPATQWAGVVTMVYRSFGAASFGRFWRYWNPLFSYYLYYKCYRPLAQVLPRSLAVVLTFAVSGTVHDLAASFLLGQVYVLFLPVFAFFGVLVVIEEAFRLDLTWASVPFRAVIHATLIAGPIIAGIVAW